MAVAQVSGIGQRRPYGSGAEGPVSEALDELWSVTTAGAVAAYGFVSGQTACVQ